MDTFSTSIKKKNKIVRQNKYKLHNIVSISIDQQITVRDDYLLSILRRPIQFVLKLGFIVEYMYVDIKLSLLKFI